MKDQEFVQASSNDDENTAVVTSGDILEVEMDNGYIKPYPNFIDFKNDILNGDVKKIFKARLKNDDEDQNQEWLTVEKIAKEDPTTGKLYRPVWTYAKEGLGYGILIGIILKAIDTGILFFAADALMGVIWVVFCASFFFRQWWAPFAVLAFVYIKFGIALNLFVTLLAVGAIGAILGAPFGLLIGTIIGHFKAKRIVKAPDAEPEGNYPYIMGLVLPVVLILIIVPLYFLWFSPMMIGLLE